MQRKPFILMSLAGFAAAWIGLPALAQNALGDGRALDRSLNTQSNYNLPSTRRAFADDLRFRNAIVTGNAAGGFSFRGDIGYTGGSDFRGSLGSEDIYTFRRDAGYSNRFAPNMRGVGGLQHQFGATAGGVLGQSQGASAYNRAQGGLLVQRAGAGTTGADYLGRDVTGARRRPATSGIGNSDTIDLSADAIDDRRITPSLGVGTLRSTAAYSTSRAFSPTLVGSRKENDGSITRLTASSLRGVRADASVPTGVTTPPNPASTQINTSALPTNPALPRTGVAQARTAYDQLMDRYRSQTETVPASDPSGQLPEWQRKLDELRATLEGSANTTSPLLGQPIAPLTPAPGGTDPAAPSLPGPQDGLYNQSTIDMIRQQAGKTDRLLLTDEARLGAYGERMRKGEAALGEGRYFDAEESFSTCLTLRPGDVAASIGRVHAQIGAGMHLSAALNLRLVLGANPQIIGERYGPSLLPAPERLEGIVTQLRENVVNADRLGQESALLLAYLGFQRGDRAMTAEGLEALDRLGAETGRAEEARFVELLRRIWLPLLDQNSEDAGGG